MVDYFTSSAQLDEHMAEVVKKYPLLYDKQKRGYRDESMKSQAWQRVAEECDVGTGDAARKLFDNLKKRFLKKRLKYRKLKASGMPADLVGAAKDEMDSYSFLNWLVPHIRMRRTKRDLTNMELSGMVENVKREHHEVYGSDEGGSSFDEQETFDDDNEMENASMVSSTAMNYISATPVVTVPSQIGEGDTLKRKSNSPVLKTEQPQYKKRNIGHPILTNGKLTAHEEKVMDDETDLFGKMIAAEIKALSPRDQCIAKHQIRTVLFELKMSHFNQSTTSQWQPPQPVYVVSGGGVPAPPHRYHSQSRVRPQGYNIDSYYPADSSISKDNSNE